MFLGAGLTGDGEVRDFVVRRYGEFVLLKPVLAWNTAVLWLGPLFLVLASVAGLASLRRRTRSALAGTPPLTAAEEARLRAIEAEALR